MLTLTVFRRAAATAVVGSLTAGMAACGATGSEGQSGATDFSEMEKVVLVHSDVHPQGGAGARAFLAFAERVDELTEGKVTFEPHFGATLLPQDEMLSGLANGLADTANIVAPYFPEEFPVFNWLTTLSSLPSESYPSGMLAASGGMNQAFLATAELTDEFASNGLRFLGSWYVHRYEMLCRRATTTPNDLHGKLARAGSQPMNEEFDALGMTTVDLPVAEMYEGMQRGVADCLTNPMWSMSDLGVFEVAKHLVPAQFSGFNGNSFAISQETWDSLPAIAQDAIVQAMPVYVRAQMENYADGYRAVVDEVVPAEGVEIHDPSQINGVLADVQTARLEGFVGSAPDGVSDPDRILESFTAAMQSWEAKVADLGGPTVGAEGIDALVSAYRDTPGAVDFKKYEDMLRPVFTDQSQD